LTRSDSRDAAGLDVDDEAGDRAHQHHPLDAEVDHARALRDQLALSGERERRPEDDAVRHRVDDEAHAGASARLGSRTR